MVPPFALNARTEKFGDNQVWFNQCEAIGRAHHCSRDVAGRNAAALCCRSSGTIRSGHELRQTCRTQSLQNPELAEPMSSK
jgi:hypothetical protein